jgi:hypothetical protein
VGEVSRGARGVGKILHDPRAGACRVGQCKIEALAHRPFLYLEMKRLKIFDKRELNGFA